MSEMKKVRCWDSENRDTFSCLEWVATACLRMLIPKQECMFYGDEFFIFKIETKNSVIN